MNNIQKIEKYLSEEVEVHKDKGIDEFLISDIEFIEKLVNYYNTVKEIRGYSREEMRNRINKIHYEVISDQDKRRNNNKTYLKVAAVFLCFIMLSSPIIYTKYFKQTNYDQLFTEYFEPYSNISSKRGVQEETNMLKESALYYYEKTEYDKALLNFEELMKKENCCDVTIQFYYGVSCLAVDENVKAIEIFNRLSEMNDSYFCEQANWYLALAYLKINKKEKTLIQLENIIESGGSYAENASLLIKRL